MNPSKGLPESSHGNTDKASAEGFVRPISTVDVLIFTVQGQRLQVLLTRRAKDRAGEPFPGLLALPGGFVRVQEDTDLQACAMRTLREKTGVQAPYLEQLGSWGSATRDPRGWSATHVYFALLPWQPALVESVLSAGASWHEADVALRARQPMAFDHAVILAAGLARLRSKVEYTSLPAFLLPEPFSLPQLQQAYEVVLGRPVDKSGFRTRMLAAGFLQEAGLVGGLSKRPAMTYRLVQPAAPVVFPRTFSPREPE